MTQEERALLVSMQAWCGRQERCTQDVHMKLVRMGQSLAIQEKVIAQLKEERFLDDERFAIAYAEGKSRLKKWGPMKVRAGLSVKRLPPELIELALSHLEESAMQETMIGLLKQHWPRIKGKTPFERKSKAVKFLMGKGYAYGTAMKAFETWSRESDE